MMIRIEAVAEGRFLATSGELQATTRRSQRFVRRRRGHS